MLLSIVIPVYNVEKYIAATLDSVFSQQVDENEYEIIVVNDGTPDNSMSIVESYSVEHSNLKIVNQENQGLSGARNAGLSEAKGDYVWFVDSDDRITPDGMVIVKNTISTHPGHDLYGFGIVTVKEDSGEMKHLSPFSNWYSGCPYNREMTFRDMGSNIFGPVARYIYRRKWLIDSGLSFWKGLLHEDLDFLPKAFACANDMWFVESDIYMYLERCNGSIMSTIKMKSYYDILKITNCFGELRKENAEKAVFFDSWMWRLVTIMLQTHIRAYGLKEEDRLEHYKFVRSNDSLFRKVAWRSISVSMRNKEWKDVIFACVALISPVLLYKYYKR